MAVYTQTVIFDCCFSGSRTRATDHIARSTQINDNVPTDLDIDIWKNALVGFQHHGLRSHVLLAACGAKELAFEQEGRGAFTSALLELLRTICAQNITYANLLQRLPTLTE
jgi:Caspase domain